MNSKARGDAAEDSALRHLRSQGLRLLTRNFRCRGGELDLVMRDGDILVFIEVRARRSGRFGNAEESVTATKQARLRRAAELDLLKHPRYNDLACRFDVVALSEAAPSPDINWIRNAFGGI